MYQFKEGCGMLRFREWLEVRRLRKKSCLKYRQGRRQFARRVEKIEKKYRRMRAASRWRLAF